MTDREENPESSEPALNRDPTDSPEAKEPTEQTDRTEPIEPIDSTDPLDPILRIDCSDPIDRSDRRAPMLGMVFGRDGLDKVGNGSGQTRAEIRPTHLGRRLTYEPECGWPVASVTSFGTRILSSAA